MDYIPIHFGENIEPHTSRDKEFDDMFQSVNPMFSFSKRVWKPQMDMFETRNEIVIQASISGVSKDNIVIEVSDKAVRICGDRKIPAPERTSTYRLAEIQFGQFERVLYLPSVIDVDRVSAHFKNGFLTLTLGKISRIKEVFP